MESTQRNQFAFVDKPKPNMEAIMHPISQMSKMPVRGTANSNSNTSFGSGDVRAEELSSP